MPWFRRALYILCLTFTPLSAAGQPQLCEAAAKQASRESDVPYAVLMAISLNETGRKGAGGFQPWPWTVNMEGAGHWFDSRDLALAYVFKEFKRGARSFDIGCFQINFKWHGQHFSSIEDMFDPLTNARYAARFLKSLYAETGDWTKAAGVYHSRTPKYARRYSERFARLHAKLAGKVEPEKVVNTSATRATAGAPEIPEIVLARTEPSAQSRDNQYPLLLRSEGTEPPGVGSAPGASLFIRAAQKARGM
ncbi:hypothetical protein B6V75_12065 [Thioclava sp. F1Mire-8]|uniref:transglycosylase SLT domain-containing protein n=1 Tax=Thioclava sp. F1Mire-8 TaxID=1973006 RepID=UPI000B53B2AD|nr:transglycosylase SLT domain-containing protein [Thioclava sp. F1Mire-8]OWY02616.1 hypothetical protein B6V75_12065 [Thioclava sp. F1Mire-8]